MKAATAISLAAFITVGAAPPAGATEQGQRGARAKGDAKASHAYVVFSDAQSVLRADTVPLAVALWRVRLWEGGGWDAGASARRVGAGGWMFVNPLKLRE